MTIGRFLTAPTSEEEEAPINWTTGVILILKDQRPETPDPRRPEIITSAFQDTRQSFSAKSAEERSFDYYAETPVGFEWEKKFDVLSNRIAKQLSARFGRLVQEHKSVALIGDRGSAIAEYQEQVSQGQYLVSDTRCPACMIVKWSERKQGSSPEGDDVL